MFSGVARAADPRSPCPDQECAYALSLGSELRGAGLAIDVFPGSPKLVAQYELASKENPVCRRRRQHPAASGTAIVGSHDRYPHQRQDPRGRGRYFWLSELSGGTDAPRAHSLPLTGNRGGGWEKGTAKTPRSQEAKGFMGATERERECF